jgi:hypothetical protein
MIDKILIFAAELHIPKEERKITESALINHFLSIPEVAIYFENKNISKKYTPNGTYIAVECSRIISGIPKRLEVC